MPKQVPPIAIERAYTRTLVAIAKRDAREIHTLIARLPALVAERKRSDSIRTDGVYESVSRMINAIRRRVTLTTQEVTGLARLIGRRIGAYSSGQLARQIKSVLGIDVSLTSEIATTLDGFIHENVRLIRSVSEQTLERTEAAIVRGLNAGHTHGEIAKEIRRTTGLGLKRAKLIARDQVGKHYTQVQRVRQTELGIERFTWVSSGDRRVRPVHVSADGESYTWAKGHPSEGLPGEPVLCRCTASPDMSGFI